MYIVSKNKCIEENLMKLKVCFFIKGAELLEKYNKIWESNNIKKGFNSETWKMKNIKTKTKSYAGKNQQKFSQ